MGLVCQARVGTKEAVDANKSTLAGVATLLASLLYARSKLASSAEESKKVAELVQVALAKLKEQVRPLFQSPLLRSSPR